MAFNVLTNKYVFYVLLVIAVANLLGYLALEDYESLTLFVAIYALSTYFSKNTIVNLSAAILATAILRNPTRRKVWPWYEREGFAGRQRGGEILPGSTIGAAVKAAARDVRREGFENQGDEGDDEGGVRPASESEEEEEVRGKNLMDYGGDLQAQMSKLKATLGPGKLKHLANETTDLANKQKELMEHMATMGPLMENAEQLLKTFEGSGMMQLVDKVMPFLERVALPGTGGGKKRA